MARKSNKWDDPKRFADSDYFRGQFFGKIGRPPERKLQSAVFRASLPTDVVVAREVSALRQTREVKFRITWASNGVL